tara:strand:+ start:241 stop:1227 length:987 start_codon:yes stop_codon:yes gene_type:complete
MNKDYSYIIVILFLVLPFIFYFWSLSRLPKVENFQTVNGCYWKYLNGPCVTANFKPSMVNIVNKDYSRDCPNYQDGTNCIGKDNLISDEEDQYYYCQVDGDCKERLIDIKNPSANNCGYNNLTESMNIAYVTEYECNKNIDKCEEKNHSKEECIKQSLCGWCTGADGKGKCVSGSPIGPNNPNYKCRPQTGQNIYNWTYSTGIALRETPECTIGGKSTKNFNGYNSQGCNLYKNYQKCMECADKGYCGNLTTSEDGELNVLCADKDDYNCKDTNSYFKEYKNCLNSPDDISYAGFGCPNICTSTEEDCPNIPPIDPNNNSNMVCKNKL